MKKRIRERKRRQQKFRRVEGAETKKERGRDRK